MTRAPALRFVGILEPGVAAALDAWERLSSEGDALPFQRRAWLAAWADTIGRRPDLEFWPVTMRDATGEAVMGLPLVRETRGLRRIGFADGGLTDYSAPILGPAAPEDAPGAVLLMRALRRHMPRADLLRFERMPRRVGARTNPLALLPGVRPSSSLGLAVTMDGGYGEWLAARPRRYRMELGRCARLFEALPGAAFERVAPPTVPAALAALERLQRLRVAALDLPYALDDPEMQAFHRALAADHDACHVYVLRAEDRIVAALFGLRGAAHFVMLRVAADPAISRLSPSRLLITRTMERLATEGVRTLDFGLGDYPYKRRLGGTPVDLVDYVAACSPRGLPEAMGHRGRAMLRAAPRTHATALWLRGVLPRFRPTRPP